MPLLQLPPELVPSAALTLPLLLPPPPPLLAVLVIFPLPLTPAEVAVAESPLALFARPRRWFRRCRRLPLLPLAPVVLPLADSSEIGCDVAF